MMKLYKTLSLTLIILVLPIYSQSYKLSPTDSLKSFVNYIASQNPKEQFSENTDILQVLNSLSKGELRIIRNALMAREGYIFNSPELDAYFKEFMWYQPRTKEPDLDEVDKLNIQLIESLEKIAEKHFNDFLSSFQTIELPIMITKDNRLSPTYSEKGLNHGFVTKYLYPTPILSDRQERELPPAAGRYYSWFKIIRSEFIIICYLNKLAAGGYLDIYTLITLSKYGDVISEERIAVYTGEATSESLSNTQMMPDLEINIEKIDITLNDFEEEKSRQITKKKYQINPEGEIVLVSVTHGS